MLDGVLKRVCRYAKVHRTKGYVASILSNPSHPTGPQSPTDTGGRPSSASSASSPPPPPSLAGGATWSSLPALVKAKSDGSLAQPDWEEGPLVKLRSRSLEPLTGLAMWSSEPHVVELVKGERGLGFSILDYQVGMLPWAGFLAVGRYWVALTWTVSF